MPVLPQESSTSLLKLVLKQFDDLLVKIMIAAAFSSFFLAMVNGDTGLTAFLEPSVILMIRAGNAAIGVITETNAEKAIEELQAFQADVAIVLHNGTVVVAGCARVVVIGVGSNIAMGSIRESMLRTEDEVTPLKKKLDEFGIFLAKVIASICVLAWLVNIGNFHDPSHGGFFRGVVHYFKIIVALAVAAIPKGLLAVVTTCLALGTKQMACLNAIVRS
ncbi:hypothetical protein Nepgr_016893 [Nepenthes gracilis]|uniref:Calcium-transporting ATPase n=1 Tax=Nepenthes gracilis TaxID=150966 RepID=A0AAD3SQ55_NEPGR|nr:hypothetical protein Nepgr_016893 [Nepenthes gracilis]